MDRNKKILLVLVFLLFVVGLYLGVLYNSHSISWLIPTVFNLILAILVYYNNPSNIINKTFALFSISIASWTFDVFGLCIAQSEVFAKIWAYIFSTGLQFVPSTGFHFLLAFTRRIDRKKIKLIYLSFFISLIFFILKLFGLFTKEYIKVGLVYTPKPTLVYTLFVVDVLFWILYGLFYVYLTLKDSKSYIIRNQLKFFLIGLLLTLVFGLINFLTSLGIKVYPMGGIASVICTGMVAYSIVKYRALDIQVFIRRSIIYGTLTFSIIIIYSMVVGFFYVLFGQNFLLKQPFFISSFFALFLAVVFLPLRNKIQTVVDEIFFKKRYNYQKIIKEISNTLSSLVTKESILDFLFDVITKTLYIEKSCLLLLDRDRELFSVEKSEGISGKIPEDIFSLKNSFIEYFRDRQGLIFTEELKEKFYNVYEELNNLGISIILPLKIKKDTVGFFLLGNKLYDEEFSLDDFELIMTISNHAIIAIENIKLYEQTKELEKALYHADKLATIGTLVSSISHEIKTPLVSLKTFTQLLASRINDRDFQKKFIEIVPQEIEHLQQIVDNLLAFAKTQTANFECIEITKIVNEILLFLQYEITKNRIEVIKNFSDRNIFVLGDEQQLRQVFLNVIMNAIQAMPSGGRLTIEIETDKNNNSQVVIKICDTGIGISPENIKKIFLPFFTTKPQGTGLGLSISNKIVKEHNGTIEFESEIGKGSIFLIKLPVFYRNE